MQAQQAKFSARQSPQSGPSPLPSELGSEEGGGGGAGGAPSARGPSEAGGLSLEGQPSAMDVDSGGPGPAGPAAAAAPRPQPQPQPLPAHHPASWQRGVEGECGLCHAGPEAGPLGWVVSGQVAPGGWRQQRRWRQHAQRWAGLAGGQVPQQSTCMPARPPARTAPSTWLGF